MFRENSIFLRTVERTSLKNTPPQQKKKTAKNRPFTTLTEIQIRLLFTRNGCLTLIRQDILNNLTSRVLLILEQSCLPIYQILETFSLFILSEQQTFKFRRVPKMRQKLFLTQCKGTCINGRDIVRCRDIAKPDILVL